MSRNAPPTSLPPRLGGPLRDIQKNGREGRSAAEGKGDVQLCLRLFNDGYCVDLKGDFNRFLSRDGTKLDPTRETKESNRFHSDVIKF